MSALYAAEGPQMDEVRMFSKAEREMCMMQLVSRDICMKQVVSHIDIVVSQVRDALFENGADGFLKTSSLQYLPTWPKWVLEQRG